MDPPLGAPPRLALLLKPHVGATPLGDSRTFLNLTIKGGASLLNTYHIIKIMNGGVHHRFKIARVWRDVHHRKKDTRARILFTSSADIGTDKVFPPVGWLMLVRTPRSYQ